MSICETIPDDRQVKLLGVDVTDVTKQRAVALLQQLIHRPTGHARSVYFVNAHTLNLAAADADYRAVLNAGDYVFGDGTGVRWAARLRGVRIRDNLVGTDLVPAFFQATANRGHRYFLLGADPESIRGAALHAAQAFPGWTLAGYHHGYLNSEELNAQAIRQINQSGADVLLVGMGNPLQERWIHANLRHLRVPVALGVGGLFQYWSGDLQRAPSWLRSRGCEWLGILCQQPHKARRYLLGNPLFLARAVADAWL